MTGSVATDQPTLVDRLLAHMQQRFPREFEICLLAAQNEELQLKVQRYENIPETSEVVDGVEYKSTEDPWTFMPGAECAQIGDRREDEAEKQRSLDEQMTLEFGEPAEG